MAIFGFNVPVYAFDQWVGASTTNTVGYGTGTSITLNPNATFTILTVEDDDGNPVGSPNNLFSDGYIDVPGDGSTPSTANNDQVLTQSVTIGGNTYPAGGQVELEFGFTTTTGETFWMIRIDGVNVGISGSVLPLPGSTYEVLASADAQGVPYTTIPCFTEGTLIATNQGAVRIEDLSVGDLVKTKNCGYQPIRWIGCKILDGIDLALNPKLSPIKIKAGALGDGLPMQDLLVSRQHRVLVRSQIARRMFGADEVLVAALSLLPAEGVEVSRSEKSVCYFHLLFDAHQIVYSNGAQTESLFAGPEALKSIPEAARQELFLLFPEFSDPTFVDRPAAFIPTGKRQRELISRHIKNGHDLLV